MEKTLTLKQYLDSLNPERKTDMIHLVERLEKLSGYKPTVHKGIIGFGKLFYQYPSGHKGEMPLIGIASRKKAITLYMSYDIKAHKALKALGPHQTGKGCLYIKRLNLIDLEVLDVLVKEAITVMRSHEFVKEIMPNEL